MFAIGGMELVNCSDFTLAYLSGKVLSMPIEHFFLGSGVWNPVSPPIQDRPHTSSFEETLGFG